MCCAISGYKSAFSSLCSRHLAGTKQHVSLQAFPHLMRRTPTTFLALMRLWAIALGLFVLVGGVNPVAPAPTVGQEGYQLLLAQGAICGGGSSDVAGCDHQCCFLAVAKALPVGGQAMPVSQPQSLGPFAAIHHHFASVFGQWPPARGPPVFTV
jgi:hypothetical protein